MDPAQEFELKAAQGLEHLNAVTDRFSSPVQQFYCGATVFVTGGSGFLGKQLVEKLFRSIKINKVYLLMRSKKGVNIQERVDCILNDPVYDAVRGVQPDFASRIIPIEGDIAEIRMGLSDTDWNTLASQVNVIFHMAAHTKFNAPLRAVTMINLRGTREIITLAKECKNLLSFVYVSTAYSMATDNHVGKEVHEQFYTSPVPPDVMIKLAETVDHQILDDITPRFIKGWQNTYMFTKAIAEDLVRTTAADLPVCVVRPPVVLASYLEPVPGWLDQNTVVGATGLYAGLMSGVLHVAHIDIEKNIHLVPVDYVNNAVIAAGWDAAEMWRRNKNRTIPVYNVVDASTTFPFKFIKSVVIDNKMIYSPKAVWYGFLLETKYKSLYVVLSWLFHYVPAYILDCVCSILKKRPKNIPSFVKMYNKVDKLSEASNYFLKNEWNYQNDNLKSMVKRMTLEDQLIFNCDLETIDKLHYLKVWIIGIRKYILKDGLKGSKLAYRRQIIYKYVSCLLLSLYAFVPFSIFRLSKYAYVHRLRVAKVFTG